MRQKTGNVFNDVDYLFNEVNNVNDSLKNDLSWKCLVDRAESTQADYTVPDLSQYREFMLVVINSAVPGNYVTGTTIAPAELFIDGSHIENDLYIGERIYSRAYRTSNTSVRLDSSTSDMKVSFYAR